MRRAQHTRAVGVGLLLAVAFAGSANATFISTPGYINENFDGSTKQNMFGWFSPANPDGTGTKATGNIGPQNGTCFPSSPGDCTYLEAKDKGTGNLFLSAGPDWGTATTPKSYMQWNGLDIHVNMIDITNQSNPNVAAAFGTIYITGSTVRTVGTCTSGCTFAPMTVYYDLGTVVTVKQWETLSAPMNPTTFFVYNGTYPPGAPLSHPTTTQWNDLLTAVTNITIDASLQTANSSEVIAIDELGIGYAVPEPGTYFLLGGGLAGLFAARKRFRRK